VQLQRSCLLQHDARRGARCRTVRRLLPHGARWSVVMNIYAQAGLIVE